MSANAERVLTCEHLLQQLWGAAVGGDVQPIRTALSKIQCLLVYSPDNPTYIFTEPKVGYRMAGGRRRSGTNLCDCNSEDDLVVVDP